VGGKPEPEGKAHISLLFFVPPFGTPRAVGSTLIAIFVVPDIKKIKELIY
jgi:hypothetical protein